MADEDKLVVKLGVVRGHVRLWIVAMFGREEGFVLWPCICISASLSMRRWRILCGLVLGSWVYKLYMEKALSVVESLDEVLVM